MQPLLLGKELVDEEHLLKVSSIQTSAMRGGSLELSQFERGTVIGCYLCNKTTREITAFLNIPQSTVSSIIRKWKCSGTTANRPRSGRPRKLTKPAKTVLKRISGHGLSVQTMARVVGSSCGMSISKRTIQRELYERPSSERSKDVDKTPDTPVKL